MRTALPLLACIALALALLAAAPAALADDGVPAPPPPPVWRGQGARPTGTGTVPVPDVRGMSEAQAASTLARAGLRLGGSERVSIATLEQELGRRYPPGIVVQQAPPPSAGDTPSWLPRGSSVWLRLSEGTPTVTAPLAPAAPRAPVARPPTTGPVVTPLPPTAPVVRPLPEAAPGDGRIPPPPPPPTYGGPTLPVVRTPARPAAPRPYVPQPVTPQPVAPQPYVPQPTAPDRAYADPYAAAPPPLDRELIGPLTTRFRLPCERGRESWHLRFLGGGAFFQGDDDGDLGPYAGLDLGYTFDGCVGLDAFYRYASTRFERGLAPSSFNDGGDTHHAGLKLTYESSLSRDSRFFVWVGLGGAWYKTRGLAQDDTGVGFYGEGGLGYLFSESVRGRLGLNAHAFETNAGRRNPASDGSDRWLWLLAPTLGIELDL